MLVARDRALAEDIVQAAFIRGYERIGQFDPARPFGPWFVRSVVNAAVQAAVQAAARKTRRTVGGPESEMETAALLDVLQDPDTGAEAALEWSVKRWPPATRCCSGSASGEPANGNELLVATIGRASHLMRLGTPAVAYHLRRQAARGKPA